MSAYAAWRGKNEVGTLRKIGHKEAVSNNKKADWFLKKHAKKKVFAKLKQGASRSMTMRKKQNSNARYGGMSQPAMYFGHGKSQNLSQSFIEKVRKAISNNNVEQIKFSTALLSNIGQCTYAIPSLLYDPNHIATIKANIVTGQPTTKFEITQADITYQITNAHQSASFMRVYECEARADVPIPATNATILANYLNQGWIDANYTNNLTDPSGMVYSSSTFVTWFKVLKQRTVEFQPGECKRFSIHDSSPHLINMERWLPYGTTALLAKEKRTKFLVFQVWGQTVNDATTGTLVSVDATKFDIIVNVRYNYRWNTDYTTTTYAQGAYGNVVTPSIVNPDTDAVLQPSSA